MPIDPNIIGSHVPPVERFSPLKAMKEARTYAEDQQKDRDEQAARESDAVISAVMQQHPEDPDTAIKVLKQRGFVGAAMKFQKLVTEERTKMVEMRGKEAENEFKLGQISAQQAEAEYLALTRRRVEDWARHLKENPALAREQAPFILGPEKWMDYEAKIEAARIAAENQVRDDERAAAQAAEAARHNTATEGLTLSGQQNTAAIAAANRAAANARAAATLQAQKDRAAAGGAAGTANLSPAQEKEIEMANNAIGLIKAAEKLGTDTNWKGVGAYQGTARQIMSNFGAGSSDDIKLRNAVGNLRGTIAALRAGLTMTAQEKAMLDTYVPNINDGDEVTIAKLQGLNDFLERKKINVVNAAKGITEAAPVQGAGATVGGYIVEEE